MNPKMNRDSLGDRMKERYENRYRILLPRRTYTIIRVDGKSFHTLLRKATKPFDAQVMRSMQNVATQLCRKIQGAQFAYQQSDEVSVLLTDFSTKSTDAWFDNNLQKIVSVAASIATVAFNDEYHSEDFYTYEDYGYFDARAFIIPDPIEVSNYFIWRQKDAERNSIQMIAQSVFSPKELYNKKISDLHEILHTKNINWNDYADNLKRGTIVRYFPGNEDNHGFWIAKGAPIFTQSDFLKDNIPTHGY